MPSSDRLVLVTAHGRVTSGCPTIELCACARYSTARYSTAAALVRCNEVYLVLTVIAVTSA
jgi:hypothetical protein